MKIYFKITLIILYKACLSTVLAPGGDPLLEESGLAPLLVALAPSSPPLSLLLLVFFADAREVAFDKVVALISPGVTSREMGSFLSTRL